MFKSFKMDNHYFIIQCYVTFVKFEVVTQFEFDSLIFQWMYNIIFMLILIISLWSFAYIINQHNNYWRRKTMNEVLSKMTWGMEKESSNIDVYDFIIDNLAGVNSIQIYNDNAIYLWKGDRQKAKLIVFEDDDFCNDELTSTMIQELISFAENN